MKKIKDRMLTPTLSIGQLLQQTFDRLGTGEEGENETLCPLMTTIIGEQDNTKDVIPIFDILPEVIEYKNIGIEMNTPWWPVHKLHFRLNAVLCMAEDLGFELNYSTRIDRLHNVRLTEGINGVSKEEVAVLYLFVEENSTSAVSIGSIYLLAKELNLIKKRKGL